jgi:hypothetical protein
VQIEEAFEQTLLQERRLDILPIPRQRIGVEPNAGGTGGDSRRGKHGDDHREWGAVTPHDLAYWGVIV